ncbi:hypothetical protein HMPREF6485_2171 [Segatella buccae ATCC 33574]|uniref:Uncharacterized protein n=1 Tax=Segatella buccae ATCC 33574 TaxID=873513 RepID=E6K985_9BACT|nr:hypothetical protein HMPREF6485_2171 [Segatella buccae ATCC 33574]
MTAICCHYLNFLSAINSLIDRLLQWQMTARQEKERKSFCTNKE